MDPLERQQWGDQLRARTTALRLLGEELAQAISQSAGRIAQTQDEVARVHDAIADNGVSSGAVRARERAEQARRFARHERREQHRWFPETEKANPQPDKRGENEWTAGHDGGRQSNEGVAP